MFTQGWTVKLMADQNDRCKRKHVSHTIILKILVRCVKRLHDRKSLNSDLTTTPSQSEEKRDIIVMSLFTEFCFLAADKWPLNLHGETQLCHSQYLQICVLIKTTHNGFNI